MEYSGRAEINYQSQKLTIHGGLSSRKFGDLIGGDTTGKQQPSGYKEQAFDINTKWKINNHSILTLASQQVIQKDVPLYHRVKLENFAYYNFSPQSHLLNYARHELNTNSEIFDKITTTFSYQISKEQRSYFKNGASNRFQENDQVNTLGLSTEVSSKMNPYWSAMSGVEWYQDLVKSTKEQINISTASSTMQRGLYPNNAKSSNFSVYSLHQFLIGKFQLNAGLRYNSFQVRMKDTAAGVNQLGEVLIKPSSLVGNIALLFHLLPNQSIYASYNTGYRAPNVDDMGTLGLVDFRYEIPAYGLKPEKSYTSEIGYKIDGRKLKTSFALFYMQLSDLVNRVQLPGQQIGGYNVYIKENNQESYVKGSELEIEYKLSKQLEFVSGLSYAFGQNTTRNEPMRRVPPFNGRILLKYSSNQWNISLENQFADKQNRLAQGDKDDNRIPKGGTPGWNVMNLYGNFKLNSVQVQLVFTNLFNVDYRMHGSGINAIGRSIGCSLFYKL
jgi:outer membrane receptor protein involved in Fe transport